MKKSTLSLFIVTLLVVFVFTSCTNTNTTATVAKTSTTATTSTSQTTRVKDEDFFADIAGKKLSYWYPMWAWEAEFAGAGDMGDVWIYQEIERVTGVTIEWIHPPVDDAQAKAAYNVLIASAQLPDIITHPYYHYYPG